MLNADVELNPVRTLVVVKNQTTKRRQHLIEQRRHTARRILCCQRRRHLLINLLHVFNGPHDISEWLAQQIDAAAALTRSGIEVSNIKKTIT